MVTRAIALGSALAAALGSLASLAFAAPPAAASAKPAPAASAPAQPKPNPAPAPARPQPAPEARAPEVEPRLHHAPVSIAVAHDDLDVRASIDHPELVKRALLVYRVGDDPALHQVEFQRASDGPYVAILPGSDVRAPVLYYDIEIEQTDGRRIAAFASRAAMQRVEVPEDLMDLRERALDTRLDGRRSVFSASGEYVSFGTSEAESSTGQVAVHDQYYRIEGAYTYRPLRTITEFSMRLGIVRGEAPVPLRAPAPGQSESDRYSVGLNYGAPTVTFRLADAWHLQAEGLLSVTELGFSLGGGGALLIGDPFGSKLVLGFESIHVFGTRFYSRLDVKASDRLTLAPMVEVTNMPSAKDYGVRLLGEVGYEIGGGFAVALRGGYQARLSTSGGPSGGASVSYAF
jgi:hypothetical protein